MKDVHERKRHNEKMGPVLEQSGARADSGLPYADCELDERNVEDPTDRRAELRCTGHRLCLIRRTDIRPMSDHLDGFQHIDRDRNSEADCLASDLEWLSGRRERLRPSVSILMEETGRPAHD